MWTTEESAASKAWADRPDLGFLPPVEGRDDLLVTLPARNLPVRQFKEGVEFEENIEVMRG
jgi:hypothetical protein